MSAILHQCYWYISMNFSFKWNSSINDLMSINTFLYKVTDTRKSKYFQTLKIYIDTMPLLHFFLGKFAGVRTCHDNRGLFPSVFPAELFRACFSKLPYFVHYSRFVNLLSLREWEVHGNGKWYFYNSIRVTIAFIWELWSPNLHMWDFLLLRKASRTLEICLNVLWCTKAFSSWIC